jgi:hypothetical protein
MDKTSFDVIKVSLKREFSTFPSEQTKKVSKCNLSDVLKSKNLENETSNSEIK